MEVASAYVALLPSARGFGTSAKRQIAPQMLPVGRSVGAGLGRSMLKGFIAIGVITKITQFVGDAFDEAREAQKVGALTVAVLKSTRGAAKVTAVEIEKLSETLSQKIGVDDEVIQASANMLLTFTKVRNEVGKGNAIFTRATATVQNMAVTFNTDASSAAKQLGKALNDPIKGVASLTRMGIQFDDQQREQIKTMVESGNVLGAQKLILKEIQTQTKNSAAATATLGDKSKVAMANVKESIGKVLLPSVDLLQKAFVEKVAPAINGFISDMQTGEGRGGAFATSIRENVVPALRQFHDYMVTKVVPALREGMKPALMEATNAWRRLRDSVKGNRSEMTQLWNGFKKVTDFILTKLIPAQMQMAAVSIAVGSRVIQFWIAGAATWVRLFNTMRGVTNAFKESVKTAAAEMSNAAQNIIVKFKGLPKQLKAIGVSIVMGLAKGIASMAWVVAAAVATVVAQIPDTITGKMKIRSPSKVTFELGLNIAEGLANGITAGHKKVSDATKKAVDGIKSQLSTLKGDFASLSESVASAFTGDLFGAETAAEFISNLMGTSNHLAALKAAFKTLIGWGLSPKFLSGLFQSGNGALILDLAASGQGAAAQAADLFGEVQSLSTSLGKDVAGTELAPRLDKMSNQLERLIKVTKDNQDKAADHIDRPAKRARRRARVHA